jgi:hypothetical protein
MRDVQASHGVLVVSSGASDAAQRRAQEAITITLVTYDEATGEYDWQFEPCLESCSPNASIGMVLWSPHRIIGLGPGWFIYRTGKCSRCSVFHAWCSDCGAFLAIPDGRVRRCSCEDREWGAIPESELSGHPGQGQSTWLMIKYEGTDYLSVDRKPIGDVKRQLDFEGPLEGPLK